MAHYTEHNLTQALEYVWELLKGKLTDEELAKLTEGDDTISCVLDEIDRFGAGGPVGLGLGRYGGHAID